jgi:hypothetical protein
MRFLMFGLWCLYYSTLGRIVFSMRYRQALRKSKLAWREFMRRYR